MDGWIGRGMWVGVVGFVVVVVVVMVVTVALLWHGMKQKDRELMAVASLVAV